MKKLLSYSLFLIGVIIVILYSLEFFFNWSYRNGTPRDKVQWVRSIENSPHYEYIILGSSRSLNSINPKLIEQKTGIKGFNLGSPANGPFEMKLMLEEFLERATADKVFIQVDYRNSEAPDRLGKIPWMPYLSDSSVYESFKKYGELYTKYKYIPYYRYLRFDSKIGLRNLALSLGGKGMPIDEYDGFIPLENEVEANATLTASYPSNVNNTLMEIQEKAASMDIKVYFFTAPILDSPYNFSPFESYLTNYKDFSLSLKDPTFFANSTHCNEKGANKFTEMFIEAYFRNKTNTHEK